MYIFFWRGERRGGGRGRSKEMNCGSDCFELVGKTQRFPGGELDMNDV